MIAIKCDGIPVSTVVFDAYGFALGNGAAITVQPTVMLLLPRGLRWAAGLLARFLAVDLHVKIVQSPPVGFSLEKVLERSAN